MRIPLPKLMRHWREKEFERHLTPAAYRTGLRLWAFLASKPALYHLAIGIAARALAAFGRKSGRFSYLPLAQGWTSVRDFPAPEGKTFHALWKARQ